MQCTKSIHRHTATKEKAVLPISTSLLPQGRRDNNCSTFTKKGTSVLKRKPEHHDWILNIHISLSTKFQLKQTILIFWTKFAHRGCFLTKKEKVNSTTEFCIFELVLVQSFSWNWQFRFFAPNLPKKGVSRHTESENHRWVLDIRISWGTKFQLKLTILSFWTKLAWKGCSPSKTEKWTVPLNSEYSN